MSKILAVFNVEGIGDLFRIMCVVTFLAAVSIFSARAGWFCCDREWKAAAVELGHAEYSQETGRWQWKGHEWNDSELDQKGGK